GLGERPNGKRQRDRGAQGCCNRYRRRGPPPAQRFAYRWAAEEGRDVDLAASADGGGAGVALDILEGRGAERDGVADLATRYAGAIAYGGMPRPGMDAGLFLLRPEAPDVPEAQAMPWQDEGLGADCLLEV